MKSSNPSEQSEEFVFNSNDDPVNTEPVASNIKLTRREEIENIKLRKTQANTFDNYVNDTGISSAFQLIFAEIISKKIPIEDHFSYAAGRLRAIGRDIDDITLKNK